MISKTTLPPLCPPGPCPFCGRRHRSWRTLAECRWPKALWVCGNGQFASVSLCHEYRRYGSRGLTAELYRDREKAEAAKRMIDQVACGHCCFKRHTVVDLAELFEEIDE